jgi:DNA-directed RNA polymerase subunit RPC12/RpoP
MKVGAEGTRCSDGGSRVCVKVRPGFFISPASADVS